MASNKKYWKSVEELNENSSIVDTLQKNEFVSEIPTDEFLGDKETLEASSTSRRDFLKYVGFATAAASLAACEGPVRSSIPYLNKPDDIIPGQADYYATTMADGFDFASILVKCREGRPIKIEPNRDAKGETNARAQASVLSLYDSYRLQQPVKGEDVKSWSEIDSEILGQLDILARENKKMVLLTGTMASPTASKLIKEFQAKHPSLEHIVYDAVSDSGALDAFEQMYGVRALPNYDFSKAETIVSIGADFIDQWQGSSYESSFIAGRKLNEGKMSRHVQFESVMSLTGANSDKRVPVTPSEQVYVLLSLYNAVVGANVSTKATKVDKAIQQAAVQLKQAGSKAVVVTGIQDKNAQLIAMAINEYLQSTIMDVENYKLLRQGDDKKVASLIEDMNNGKVGALFISNCNPIYTLADSNKFVTGLSKVALSVNFSMQYNETSVNTTYSLATSHYLENWGDIEMKKGNFSLMQPTIKPLFDSRQLEDCLMVWLGKTEKYVDYLKKNWNENILEGRSWNTALHDGYFISNKGTSISKNEVSVSSPAAALLSGVKPAAMELQLYMKTGLGDGQQANNPWLQELPDPITRAAWDNYLTISAHDAKENGLMNRTVDNGALNGSKVNLTVNGVVIENVGVLIQPGQARGSVGLALGYGRTQAMKEEMMVGVNAYKFYQNSSKFQSVTIEKIEGEHKFACEQLQHTIAGRDTILKETSLEEYNDKSLVPAKTWNLMPVVSLKHEETDVTDVDLWESHDRTMGHHFNLSVDLSACTGCGACVIACHAENNVAVVGKHEVRVGRDMHWLRIDRYYSSEISSQKEAKESGMSMGDMYAALERPEENPEVAFQPIMCQHCNHAPCETVCPVAATSHGRQGQNHMAYNRCVGTRYCANNCPYRVRRFNWFRYADNDRFDFNMNDQYGKMVLNPDVVVRSRGVMEKCSMCIQMTQATILQAKKERRKVRKDEFHVACSDACSTNAMVFGDINEEKSPITEMLEDKRSYHLLEEVGTKPNVVYQVKVRNTTEA
ncbi:MAG: TAT-variant-translocated molybdopterin oxidoreductase [Flavobacteriaceae bacterium]|nr:TAT-variant-translocated molybdopterin oxidoreductase [Flavobacteriaceae bacterium]